MKGSAKVIEILNEALTAELTAINQYFIHAKMCENWGYVRLYHHMEKESIDEMRHAERLIERILFLDGTPNMVRYFKLNIGKNVKEILKNDLTLELEAVERLQRGIKWCLDESDNNSRELLRSLLDDEEEHVDWMEAQNHMIDEMGYEYYLSQQMFDEEEHTH